MPCGFRDANGAFTFIGKSSHWWTAEEAFPGSAEAPIVAYYSILYTPKEHIDKIFAEFNRILNSNGRLLVVVKGGDMEGVVDNEYYEGNTVYFARFMENEVRNYFTSNGFSIDLIDTRKPYDFEFHVERIYAIGTKLHSK